MPAIQLQPEEIVAALQRACRPPSLHNSQPWSWVANDHVVGLLIDPARLIRSTDTTGREALISCSAIFDHFVLLDSEVAGMSTCTPIPVTEVPMSRDIAASLIPGDAIPQVLTRAGVAPPFGCHAGPDTAPPDRTYASNP